MNLNDWIQNLIAIANMLLNCTKLRKPPDANPEPSDLSD